MNAGIMKPEPHKCFSRVEQTLKSSTVLQEISPIAGGSRELSIVTPKSTISSRRSLYQPTTPLPSFLDLTKCLNDWLIRRGKRPIWFYHLKCFGTPESALIDEENKENIEVEQDLDKGSYEDLKIVIEPTCEVQNDVNNKPIVLNEQNTEAVARAALGDLQKLIEEGYPRPQIEGWLELIRLKYRQLEEEPQYWECRAAIEQSRGNVSNAVECYKTAIVQGAEIQAVDESLDTLLQKFNLLNIRTDKTDTENRQGARIVQDARNVFKSTIIQFAIRERKLKHTEQEAKRLIATPVRRSTRLSRTAYMSTPSIKLCSSLYELNDADRDGIDFKKNKALF